MAACHIGKRSRQDFIHPTQSRASLAQGEVHVQHFAADFFRLRRMFVSGMKSMHFPMPGYIAAYKVPDFAANIAHLVEYVS